MLRVWLTCALATAAVVAAVLLLTDKPDAKADGIRPPEPPPRLSEQEVRTYIELMPEIKRRLGEVAIEFQRARERNDLKVDEAEFGIRSQAIIDSLIEQRHLTRETWEKLQKRVAYAVDVVRATGQDLEVERAGIEERLGMKRALLPKLAREDEREALEKEIRYLEDLLAGKGPPLLDEDRDLVRQYWRALDLAVPRRGPPPKPQEPK